MTADPLRLALAVLLEVDLTRVPDVMAAPLDARDALLGAWLADFGLAAVGRAPDEAREADGLVPVERLADLPGPVPGWSLLLGVDTAGQAAVEIAWNGWPVAAPSGRPVVRVDRFLVFELAAPWSWRAVLDRARERAALPVGVYL